MRRGVGGDTTLGEAPDHHERILGSPAQALRTGQQEHQRGVILRPPLRGAPGEIERAIEGAFRQGLFGLLATILPGGALRRRGNLVRGSAGKREPGTKKEGRSADRHAPHPSRLRGSTANGAGRTYAMRARSSASMASRNSSVVR